MWLKWLGSLIVLGACVLFGLQKGQALRKREQQLQDFLQLCHRMETEISYGQTPLPQIFMDSSERIGFPVGAICRDVGGVLQQQMGDTLSVIWQHALEKTTPALSLGQEDMAVVKTIGSELGLSYSREQMKKLQLIVLRLQEQERLAHEERLKMEKVWQVLGWCGGGMLVLLLL